ncbi:hypothetical protein HYN59_15415 [Flavobacterium album]|uniref:Uncharacterized protein n=1 Tax=Flavobacterium album TaxID=2175091 RepID=A0A2S1R1J3_9FLAO|nr:hypothetical protein [Flavobacterium album]AWH86411.1 hypothetical protein HYN59_15415 [Flavobacterium album]
MKVFMLAAVLLALAPKGCEEDVDEKSVYETTEQADYEEMDYRVRNAVAEWKLFKKESESNIIAAKVRISKATDKLDDPNRHHKLKLRNAIIDAEGQLEQLSEKLLRGERFEEKADSLEIDASVIKRMENFMESYREKEAKLKETLSEMEKVQ